MRAAPTGLGSARPVPTSFDALLYLAGPTPRTADVASCRPQAVAELSGQWSRPGRLVVYVPGDPQDLMTIKARQPGR